MNKHMDEMYGLQKSSDAEYVDKALMSPENLMLPAPADYDDYHSMIIPSYGDLIQYRIDPVFGSEEELGIQCSVVSESVSINVWNQGEGGDEDEQASTVIKAKIASHPSYPKLLHAYIDCQKVGAPPEMVSLLDEIKREEDLAKQEAVSMSLGVDPQLDAFMEAYYDILVKYKTDLSTPVYEATSFLNKIEAQLSNLCNANQFWADNNNGGLSSDDELIHGEIERQDVLMKSEDQQLKEKLLCRYGSHITSLKLEFSKKKKKGKLPKEARQILLQWWNLHSKWPYPTEADKSGLAELTGLDQKQINNWFINQRKRHWKSPESMRLAVAESSNV